MAQYRQSGFDRFGFRSYDLNHYGSGTGSGSALSSDHVAIGVRAAAAAGGHSHKQPRHRRLGYKTRGISIGTLVLVLCLFLAASVFAFINLSGDQGIDYSNAKEDNFKNDQDFLANVTPISNAQVKFGRGSVSHGRDSRYWDGDDRRRDEDYDEDVGNGDTIEDKNEGNSQVGVRDKSGSWKLSNGSGIKGDNHQSTGLYNEAGRNMLKMYEEKYEASLKEAGQSDDQNQQGTVDTDDGNSNMKNGDIYVDDEYDDWIDSDDARMEDSDSGHENNGGFDPQESHSEHADQSNNVAKNKNMIEVVREGSSGSLQTNSRVESGKTDIRGQSNIKSNLEKQKGKSKHCKYTPPCEMKFLSSTSQLVEPFESRKFSRFSLQYAEIEDKPAGVGNWEPRFAGHQSLREREDSFMARDQTINCGFVKGPQGYPSNGFDLAEDDSKYISKCHVAVVSCIFGISDRLRSPVGKTVSRLSRKNVCFVMFVDAITLETLNSKGQVPDRMGFIGIWKVVVVKNLPYTDMRRVGKVPKLLAHRLFPSARYSIWLDSKLRLQQDPLLILEYFLWRKGYEYAISNHYDRHCVWEEVAQNKKLNKYNHTVIDQQFAFYQADGLKRFNASDAKKLLPSNVAEGSFIIRAHTPMSNLFSCLWFNEVDRFTPRDQLSFAYTYQKLRKKNPRKPFYLNMFKDCERRNIAKLFHHRSEENRGIHHKEAE